MLQLKKPLNSQGFLCPAFRNQRSKSHGVWQHKIVKNYMSTFSLNMSLNIKRPKIPMQNDICVDSQ